MNNEGLILLKDRIRTSGLKITYLLERLEMSRPTFINRLKGVYPFTIAEANTLREVLKLTPADTLYIFFGVTVNDINEA